MDILVRALLTIHVMSAGPGLAGQGVAILSDNKQSI